MGRRFRLETKSRMPKDIELIQDAIQERALTVSEIAAELGLNGRTVYRRIALLTG